MTRQKSDGEPFMKRSDHSGTDAVPSAGFFQRSRVLALLSAGLLVSAAIPVEAAQEISFEQAIHYALKQNRELQLVRMSASQSDIALDEAANEFKITLTPQASYNSGKDSPETGYGLSLGRKIVTGARLDVSGQSLITRPEGSPDLHRDTLIVGLQQPLLRSAGVLINREPLTLAESRQTAARREIELRKTDIVVRVAEAYEELLRLEMEQELQKRTIVRLERLLKLAKAREKQGRVTRVDTLRSEIRLGDASLLASGTAEQLRNKRADFAELLGFQPSTDFTPLSCPAPSIAVDNIQTAVQTALSNRLDYAQIRQDYGDVRRGIRIARRNLLPDLNLALNYQKTGEDTSIPEAARVTSDSWFVGLEVHGDLPMRSQINAVKRAAIDVEIAKVRIDAFKEAIEKQVMQAFSVYERAKSEISTAEKNFQLAGRQVEFARKMFERGKGDSFSASDAEDELQSAQTKWLGAQSAAAVSAYRLLRVTGILMEYPADLRPSAANK